MSASTYTRADVIADARKLFPDTDTFADADIAQYANEIIQDIATQIEIPELEKVDTSISLATDTQSYALTSIYPLAVLSVKNTTQDTVLSPLDINQADQQDESSGNTGEPTAYFRFGTSLYVYPTPSSDYNGDTLRIRYIDTPTGYTSSSSSTTSLPERFDAAIKFGTLYHLYTMNDEPERAASMYVKYMGVLKRIQDNRAREYRYEMRGIGVLGLHGEP